MLHSTEELRQLRQVAAKAATPKFGPAAGTLTLPRLKEIPLSMVNPSAEWAILTLRWLETGWQPKDETKPAQYLVQEAMAEWLDNQLGKLHVTSLVADVSLTVEQAIAGGYQDGRTGAEFNDEAYLALSSKNCEWHLLTPLAGYEERHPGLGQTALQILGILGCRLLEIITPEYATSMAEWIWWQGETTQEDWLKMMIEYNECDESELETDTSPDTWHASFPEWQIKPKKLSSKALRKIAKRAKEPQDKALAALLLKFTEGVMSLQTSEVYDYWEGQNIKPAAIFDTSGDGEMLSRLIDDFDQQNMESGDGYEAIALHAIPFDPDLFHQWKATMEKRFYAIRLLDKMVSMISIPYQQ